MIRSDSIIMGAQARSARISIAAEDQDPRSELFPVVTNRPRVRASFPNRRFRLR